MELTKFLERHGVYISRWFYDSDPRTCWDERLSSSLSLEELATRHGNSRLLLFGDGARLQDASTGELYSWTEVFVHWKDRAILTPQTPEAWGDPEFLLAELFDILPATSRGLVALAERYGSAGTSILKSIDASQPVPDILFSPLETDEVTKQAVEKLGTYLGDNGFHWLCACALYPELHWDVTLRLGALPEAGSNLLTEQILLKLIRLPWFRTGTLPIILRQKLIESGDKALMNAACRLLITILERAKPPKGTHALDKYEISLAFQRWLIENSLDNKNTLKARLETVPVSSMSRDLLAEVLVHAPGQAGGRAIFPPPIRIEETAATEVPDERKLPESTWKELVTRLNLAIQSFLSPNKGSKSKETSTNLVLSFAIASIAIISSAQYIPWADLPSLLSDPSSTTPNNAPLHPNPNSRPPAETTAAKTPMPSSPSVTTDNTKSITKVPGTPSGTIPVEVSTIGLYDIFFQRNSYTINTEAKNRLQQNAAILLNNPALKIRLDGHVDERGTSPYNMVLAGKRARAVLRYLVSLGVTNSFRINEMGKERPFCIEHTESCYQLNNRVHFIVLEGGNTSPTNPNPESPIINEIVLLGNTAFARPSLMAGSNLRVGMAVNQSETTIEAQRLTDFYGERGYPFAEVTPNITTNDAAKTTVVTLNIREGKLTRIRQINISGNSLTPDNIIRSQITLDETEILNTRALKDSYQRLLSLGLFDEVEILPRQVSSDKVDLEVRVTEKSNNKYNRALKDQGSLVDLQRIYLVVVDTLGNESVFTSESNNIIPRRELELYIRKLAGRLKIDPKLNLPRSAKIKTDIVESSSEAEVFIAILGKQDNTLPEDFLAELELSQIEIPDRRLQEIIIGLRRGWTPQVQDNNPVDSGKLTEKTQNRREHQIGDLPIPPQEGVGPKDPQIIDQGAAQKSVDTVPPESPTSLKPGPIEQGVQDQRINDNRNRPLRESGSEQSSILPTKPGQQPALPDAPILEQPLSDQSIGQSPAPAEPNQTRPNRQPAIERLPLSKERLPLERPRLPRPPIAPSPNEQRETPKRDLPPPNAPQGFQVR